MCLKLFLKSGKITKEIFSENTMQDNMLKQ